MQRVRRPNFRQSSKPLFDKNNHEIEERFCYSQTVKFILTYMTRIVLIVLWSCHNIWRWMTSGILTLNSCIYIFRPHRISTHVDAAYCYRLSREVCRSVCHDREPCRNRWTDRDVVWDVDSGGQKKARIRWGCTLAQPGTYNRTVHVRRRCVLLSNYFNYLFAFLLVAV